MKCSICSIKSGVFVGVLETPTLETPTEPPFSHFCPESIYQELCMYVSGLFRYISEREGVGVVGVSNTPTIIRSIVR